MKISFDLLVTHIFQSNYVASNNNHTCNDSFTDSTILTENLTTSYAILIRDDLHIIKRNCNLHGTAQKP